MLRKGSVQTAAASSLLSVNTCIFTRQEHLLEPKDTIALVLKGQAHRGAGQRSGVGLLLLSSEELFPDDEKMFADFKQSQLPEYIFSGISSVLEKNLRELLSFVAQHL